jgi:hypothetical protein
MTPLARALVGVALFFASGAQARELWSNGEASVEFTGSLKGIARATHGTDATRFGEIAARDPRCIVAAAFERCSAFSIVGDKSVWQGLARARFRFDVTANEHLSGVLVYDHELLFGTLDTLGAELGESFRLDSLADLTWDVKVGDLPTDTVRWRHRIYRGFLRFEAGPFEASIGRQRIPWGVGRLWNPADRFNAIGPLAIERDQVRGVDAVAARWNFSGFDYAEAVYQPNSRSEDAAYGLRLHGTRGEVDVSLLGGRWESDWGAGFDVAANVGDAALRMEFMWTHPTRDVWPIGAPAPDRLDDFVQAVVSLDYSIPIGKGLYVLVEHLYNGNSLGFGGGRPGVLLPFFESTATPPPGVPAAAGPFVGPASPAVFGGSRVISNASHQTGLQLGYDVTPIIRADFLTLVDWNGGSVVFAPILAFSPIGSVELTLGAQLFAGPRLSQYGSQEHLGYFMAEWFF